MLTVTARNNRLRLGCTHCIAFCKRGVQLGTVQVSLLPAVLLKVFRVVGRVKAKYLRVDGLCVTVKSDVGSADFDLADKGHLVELWAASAAASSRRSRLVCAPAHCGSG